jgi:multiple sugar transport system ATP-binding protein
VAIGRAIVRQAQLFLFDEPLSNLDAKLRDEMRGEIKRLHKEIATTMIYVTHDQVEAMTLADRIVLLRDGRIEQHGAPLDLYERPATGFVAGFLGSPSINRVPAKLVTRDGQRVVVLDTGEQLPLPPTRKVDGVQGAEKAIFLCIRPQHLTRARDESAAAGVVRIPVKAELIQPTGTRTYVTARLGGVPVTAELGAHDIQGQDTSFEFEVDLNRCFLIDPVSDKVL